MHSTDKYKTTTKSTDITPEHTYFFYDDLMYVCSALAGQISVFSLSYFKMIWCMCSALVGKITVIPKWQNK